MSKTTTLIEEQKMSKVKKSDCIAVQDAVKQLGISRNTLNTYMAYLQIEKQTFRFDTKAYITNVDLERLQQFIEERKQ